MTISKVIFDALQEEFKDYSNINFMINIGMNTIYTDRITLFILDTSIVFYGNDKRQCDLNDPDCFDTLFCWIKESHVFST